MWNRDLAARYADLLLVAGYLDAGMPTWIGEACGVPAVLSARPAVRRLSVPRCSAGGGGRSGGGGRCRR